MRIGGTLEKSFPRVRPEAYAPVRALVCVRDRTLETGLLCVTIAPTLHTSRNFIQMMTPEGCGRRNTTPAVRRGDSCSRLLRCTCCSETRACDQDAVWVRRYSCTETGCARDNNILFYIYITFHVRLSSGVGRARVAFHNSI